MALKHEVIASDLAVIIHNGTVQCFLTITQGKEENDAPTTLEMLYGKVLPHLDLMISFSLLARTTGVNSGCRFESDKDLEKTGKDDGITCNSNYISYRIFLKISTILHTSSFTASAKYHFTV